MPIDERKRRIRYKIAQIINNRKKVPSNDTDIILSILEQNDATFAKAMLNEPKNVGLAMRMIYDENRYPPTDNFFTIQTKLFAKAMTPQAKLVTSTDDIMKLVEDWDFLLSKDCLSIRLINPFSIAAYFNRPDIIEYDFDKIGQYTDLNNNTPLHWAIFGEANTSLERLLQLSHKRPSPININTPNKLNRKTPLHLAAQYGNCKAIELLSTYYADFIDTGASYTLLNLAIIKNHRNPCQVITTLLQNFDKRALLNQKSLGSSCTEIELPALVIAAEQQNKSIIRTLLHYSEHIQIKNCHLGLVTIADYFKNDFLFQKECFQKVIEARSINSGALKSIIDDDRFLKIRKIFNNNPKKAPLSPILVACYFNATYLVHELIDGNVYQLYATDKHGWSPLHWAVHNGNIELTQALIQYNAPINQPDKQGNTPLHIAAQKDQNAQVIDELIKSGAYPFQRNNKQKTPYNLATDHNKTILQPIAFDRSPNSINASENPISALSSTQLTIYGQDLQTHKLIHYAYCLSEYTADTIPSLQQLKNCLHTAAPYATYKNLILQLTKISNLKGELPRHAAANAIIWDYATPLDRAVLLPTNRIDQPLQQLFFTMPLTVGHCAAATSDEQAQSYLHLLDEILGYNLPQHFEGYQPEPVNWVTLISATLQNTLKNTVSFLLSYFYSNYQTYTSASDPLDKPDIAYKKNKLACGFVLKQLMAQTHKESGLTMGSLLVFSRKNASTIQQYLRLVTKLLHHPNFQAHLQVEASQLRKEFTDTWLDEQGHIRLQNYTNLDPTNPYHMILWTLGAVHLDSEYTKPNATIALNIGAMAEYADPETMKQLLNLLQTIINHTDLGFDLLRNPINPAANSNTLGHIIAQNQDSSVFDQFLNCLAGLDASYHRAILQTTNDHHQTIEHVITDSALMKIYLDHLNTLSSNNLHTILCSQDQDNESLGHVIAKQHSDQHTQQYLSLLSEKLNPDQISDILQIQSDHEGTIGRIIASQAHQSIARLQQFLNLIDNLCDNDKETIQKDVAPARESIIDKLIGNNNHEQYTQAINPSMPLGQIIRPSTFRLHFHFHSENNHINQIRQLLADEGQNSGHTTDNSIELTSRNFSTEQGHPQPQNNPTERTDNTPFQEAAAHQPSQSQNNSHKCPIERGGLPTNAIHYPPPKQNKANSNPPPPEEGQSIELTNQSLNNGPQ